jgi:bromodomain and PHD finger-containing protein 1
MVLDFDLKTFCENLKATKPPYECPFPECGKIYKSYSGIQFHLSNYDHDNPDGGKAGVLCKKKGAGRGGRDTPNRCNSSASLVDLVRSPAANPPEPLTYAEAQRMVEVELDGQIYRINIHESLDIISQDEIDNCDNTEKEEKLEKDECPANEKEKKDIVKLPEASFKVLTDYVKPIKVPPRGSSYYRYIERSQEEMDEEVEYDMDEEVRVFVLR